MKPTFRIEFFALLFTTIATQFIGCKSDVDLKNIDKRVDAQMGLALPVGSMNFTINDFLGNGRVANLYIDSLDNKGVLTYCDTFEMTRPFHTIDLTQYLSKTVKEFDVYDKLKDLPIFADEKITGIGVPITLEFPLVLTLSGLNKDSTIENERIDSAYIVNAQFISTISCENFDMDWDWIDKVQVELGNEFSRPEGRLLTVYSKGESGDWNTPLPIEVNEFSMCLMKDKGKNKPVSEKTFFWYSNNVIDSCTFKFLFTFTIPKGQVVSIPKNSRYRYQFGINFVDYKALWGYFCPSNKMRDEDTIIIANEWKAWNYFQKMKLPLAQPRINLHITTQLAGALRMVGDYLFTKSSSTQEQKYATFDQAMTQHKRIEDATTLNYLTVEDSEIGDSVLNNIQFSEAWNEGHIDNLFSIRPDILAYKYYIELDKYTTPQARINHGGTDIHLKAIATLPFTFKQGTSLDYNDTIPDVNLSKLSLDSLLAEAKWIDSLKTSDLKLVLTVHNTIPLRIKGILRFLDQDGQDIPDPTNPSQPIRFSDTDTLYFNTPTYEFSQDQTAYISEAGISTFTLNINKQHFNEFARIKNIQLHAIIDDETMQYIFEHDRNFRVKIMDNSSIKLQIGVAANVDAIINMQSKNDK